MFVWPREQREIMDKGPRTILIIQTAFLGDVILATAMIEKLHSYYPAAMIDMLVRKGNESLLTGHPYLRDVLVFDKKDKTRSLRQLVQGVRRRRYDVVINAQRFFSSGLIAVLSGARQIIGYDKNPLSCGYSQKVKHQVGDGTHEVARNQRLLARLTDEQWVRPKLYPGKASFATVPADETYVTISPTSVWFTKQWPADKWVELIRLLPAEETVYLLGGPGDRAACEAIRLAAARNNVQTKAGELSLLDSAAWMASAKMNYANDSAPIHLASAMNAPMTAVFCSTVPAFGFTPLSDQSRVVEYQGVLSCRPCGLHGHQACPEGHFRCADIDPQRVLSATREG